MTELTEDRQIDVPASLIEDIHYHLTRYDEATSRVNAGHHLTALWNKVGDLATWHPGYDDDKGTLPWERDDDD